VHKSPKNGTVWSSWMIYVGKLYSNNPYFNKRLINEYNLNLKSRLTTEVGWEPVFPNEYSKLIRRIYINEAESPYYGGLFYLDIIVYPEYPYKPPKIQFITKIYHLNISFNGDLCLEILGQYWIPAIRIAGVLENIRAMLLVPNSDKPYEWEIGNLYKTNLKEYFDKERMDEKICVSI